MTHVFCTLFNKNYLDKALVTIESLLNFCENQIFVLCMDKECFLMMSQLSIRNVTLIDIDSIMTLELKKVKDERSSGEFCWTCTAFLIKYILETYHFDTCTYIDADLKFYSNPMCLIQEMIDAGCEVQIIPHWFTNGQYDQMKENKSGKYCVEFNTFSNKTKSLELLKKWVDLCIKKCNYECAGDQKYINDWDKLPFVNVTKNRGAGIAPWNIKNYKLIDKETVLETRDKKKYKIIFYHFQRVLYKNKEIAFVDPYIQHFKIDDLLFQFFYYDYLRCADIQKKKLFDRFGFYPLLVEYISKENIKKIKKSSFLRLLFHRNFIVSLHIIFEKIRRVVRKRKIYIRIDKVYIARKQMIFNDNGNNAN